METVRNDLTEGVIWKKLLAFAMPVFLGNVFQQLYNMADSVIVGWFLGDQALAAVSSSANLIFMMVGFFNGVAMGAGILIARHFGARDYEEMEKAIHTDVAFGLCTGMLLTVLGVIFTPTILQWMGTPADVLPESISYFRYYFYGAVFTVMYNIFVGILHAMGDSRHPLYYLIISSFVNVVLDLLFVGMLRWGVGSAALATTISQGLSAALCCIRLMRAEGPGKLVLRKIRFHGQTLREIIGFGLPSGVQNSVIGLANVVVQSNINAFGTAAMAGCGSYAKLEGFAFLPVTCFVQGLSTFVGQNLGAKKYDRAKKGAAVGISCSMAMAAVVSVIFYLFAPQLLNLFNGSPDAVNFGVRHCRIICLFYALLAFSHCVSGIMRGAGRAVVPMLTTLSIWCVLRVCYISVCVRLFPYLETVSWAYPITWILSSTVFLILLLKGDWVHALDRMDRKKASASLK